jgi:hypothetical protein
MSSLQHYTDTLTALFLSKVEIARSSKTRQSRFVLSADGKAAVEKEIARILLDASVRPEVLYDAEYVDY